MDLFNPHLKIFIIIVNWYIIKIHIMIFMRKWTIIIKRNQAFLIIIDI